MWFFYSLFFAIWSAIYALLIKKWTNKIDTIPLLFILLLFAIPFIFILLIFTTGIPRVTTNFYIFMLVSALLDVLAFTFQFNAIRKSSISLIAPIASFTPLFTTLIATFTLGEIPTSFKFLGIILIVFGAYLLSVDDMKKGVIFSLKKILTNNAVQLALLSTFIWAITPIFQKKAIAETSPQIPLYASFIGMCFACLLLAPLVLQKVSSYKKEISLNFKLLIFFGIGTAFSQWAAYTAFSLTNVGYATTVMKLSGLFSIILGGLFLKEQKIKEKFVAGIVMLAGVFILVI